jgi:alkylation response protein AidB-like acyl-CoA dehydrogenase
MQAGEDRQQGLRMIRDSAAAIAPRSGDLKRIRALRFQDPGFERQTWREMCDLGWLGLLVPEECRGSGLGMGEFCALVEELGAGLVPEPLIPGVMAARLLSGQHLDRLLSGQSVVIPAWQERPNTLVVGNDTVLRDGRLYGRKVFVPMPAGADAFLVAHRGGLALFDRNAAGVSVHIERTQDGGNVGTLTLNAAPAESLVGEPGDALEEATLATAAYMLGVMEGAFRITLGYMKTRQQFGRPIGSFQVLQHRAADLKIQLSLTRASVESAAATLDESASEPVRRAAVSRAKARASEAGLLVTRQCIQLHGGIGYTDEYDIGLYLRKAMVLCNQYGSAALHRARYADIAPEREDE